MKLTYRLVLFLVALSVAADGRPLAAQDAPPNSRIARQRTVLFSADPLTGTWKLNVAKSKFGSGPVYKSILVKIESQGNSLRYVVDSVNVEGNAIHYEFILRYDGKDYPVTGNPTLDTVAGKKIDANTVDLVFKKGGKEALSRREVTSKDGKTRTVTTRGKDTTGRDINATTVFDKQ